MIFKEFGFRKPGRNYMKRPGVYGIGLKEFDGDLKVAVVLTKGGYFLPGGGIEEGEDHESCLAREFIEETGLDVKLGSYIGKANQVGFTPSSKRYIELKGNFYFVDILEHIGGQVEEDHQLLWINVQEAIKSMRLGYQSYAINEGIKLFNTSLSTDEIIDICD